MMVSRVVILCRMVAAFQGTWVLEQPCGSLMDLHPDFQALISEGGVHQVWLAMSSFGGQHHVVISSVHESFSLKTENTNISSGSYHDVQRVVVVIVSSSQLVAWHQVTQRNLPGSIPIVPTSRM